MELFIRSSFQLLIFIGLSLAIEFDSLDINQRLSSLEEITSSQQTVISNQQSMIANQQAMIANHQYMITNMQSVISSQQSVINEAQLEFEEIGERIVVLANATDEHSVGTTYVRWGRTVCPDTAQLIYEGYAASSIYHPDSGGGVNYQCLPEDPEFPDNAAGGYQSNNYIYGVEYQTNDGTPVWPSSIHDHDVPCAVCEAEGRTAHLMIPAKQTCPIGWTREYFGILVSKKYIQNGSTFECVDSEPETVDGGSPNQDGGLFYPVEAKCGSLKCPPYVSGFEFSCVVCTK